MTTSTEIAAEENTNSLNTNSTDNENLTNSDRQPRGVFIVLEGIDRCGKSSQTKQLSTYLSQKQIEFHLQRFPDRSSPITGQVINGYLTGSQTLDDRCIHLLFSANRHEFKQRIIDHLQQGRHVICDRYSHSGIAYTAAKTMEVSDTESPQYMSIDWCSVCEQGLPMPDCVVFLDISLATVTMRGKFGEERYEKIDFLSHVKHVYEQLREADAQQHRNACQWKVVDANRGVKEIHSDICDIFHECVDTVQQTQKPITFFENIVLASPHSSVSPEIVDKQQQQQQQQQQPPNAPQPNQN